MEDQVIQHSFIHEDNYDKMFSERFSLENNFVERKLLRMISFETRIGLKNL